MELERWALVSAAVSAVAAGWARHPRDRHSTAQVARVYLWAALFERPMTWACDPANWHPAARPADAAGRPAARPDPSTMSRRTRRADFLAFLAAVGRHLNGPAGPRLVRVVDGKPLELPNHTGDPDAAWGRGVSRLSVGYKVHAVFSGNPMPDAVAVTPLDRSEKDMAARLVGRLPPGGGYLLADANFDASWLYDVCHYHGYQLVCPRAKPGTGLGHHYVSPHRRRAVELLEPPAGVNPFGRALYNRRSDIERDVAQLVCAGGGLIVLPAWVRRIWRVRNWVWAKLLLNAARICLHRKRAVGA